MMWHDVIQNEDEWFDMRVGRLGGSSIGKVMAHFPKAFGKPAHDKAVQIALEKLRGRSFEDSYSNAHMERGHEQEPIARCLYEETQFSEVTNGGYFTEGDNIGVSPDGLVDDDGVVEIKSVIDTVHFETVNLNRYDPKYKWQTAFELKVSKRDWLDYVEFCSDFPEGKKLFIQRIYASDIKNLFNMIDKRLSEFFSLVTEKIKVIREIEN